MKGRRETKRWWAIGGIIGLAVWGAWSCQVPDPTPSPYEAGVYILNAGSPAGGNGTISFLPRGSRTPTADVFKTANPNLTLDGQVQGYTELNGKGLLLVNNSSAGKDRIEIVDVGTFRARMTIGAPGIENPREVLGVGPNKAYVSCWDVPGAAYADSGYVAVIDLNRNTVTKKIRVGSGPERMVVVGSNVFVGNAENSGNHTLAILDVTTDVVRQRIDFNAVPQPIALDADGKVWVQAGTEVVRLDPQTRVVEKRLTFPGVPQSMVLGEDQRTFYFTLNGATHRFTTASTFISTANPVVARAFSAMGVDRQTGLLYGSVIPSLTQAGYVLRYQLPNGALIDTVRAQIAPSKFFFQ